MDKCEIVLPKRGKDCFVDKYIGILNEKKSPAALDFAVIGASLWAEAEKLPTGFCHMDMHRGNVIKVGAGSCIIDFDTSCTAFPAYDVAVFCDCTNYFSLKAGEKEATERELERFLNGYTRIRTLEKMETDSVYKLIALRHFQLQAIIIERFGLDSVDEGFFSSQLRWLDEFLS